MNSFRWIATAIAMILGLGVTRLLAAFIEIFRSRTHAQLDWVPLVWAVLIFAAQMQFWWAIVELQSLVKIWTLGSFLLLMTLPLLLFVAAALIIPKDGLGPGESMRTPFERDGRWALVAVSAYNMLAMFVDWYFWGALPVSLTGAAGVVLVVLPCLGILAARSRRVEAGIVLVYALLYGWQAWQESPASYS